MQLSLLHVFMLYRILSIFTARIESQPRIINPSIEKMPLEYGVPEALHYVGWSYPVDIWSVGLMSSQYR